MTSSCSRWPAGLYDPCLSLHLESRAVGNDVNADGKRLVMITGANQGGKLLEGQPLPTSHGQDLHKRIFGTAPDAAAAKSFT
jgi:hypothetical protein